MRFTHRVLRRCCTVLAVLLAFCLLATTCTYATAATFKDLPQTSAAYPYANYVAGKGLLTGYSDGSFKPNQAVTRAEMATILVKVKGIKGYKPVKPTFKDVKTNHPSYQMIEAANRAGLMKGYTGGYFKPAAAVTRADAATLLLSLTKQPLPAVNLPAAVKDVKANHPAKSRIAAALDAGIMTMVTTTNFSPNAPITRAQLARGLAVILTTAPEYRNVPLTGTLAPVKGEVTLTKPNQQPQKISTPSTCQKGVTIKTGTDGQAELKFPDGSTILLKPDTELTIQDIKGQSYLKKDGTLGTTVDWMEINLLKGRIFGVLATTYLFHADEKKTDTGFLTTLLRGLKVSVPWWKEASAKKVRVKVDMPWGVTGVRGTMWSNQVDSTQNLTSVADGETEVTSAGTTVTVLAGQATTITSSTAAPTTPAAMTAAEQKAWAEVKSWVQEVNKAIQANMPVGQPTTAPGNSGDNSGWIYYVRETAKGPEVCKVRADGTNRQVLTTTYGGKIAVDGDWIYYEYGSGIYRIRKDGTGASQVISDDSIQKLQGEEGWLYYTRADDGGLYKVRTDGTGKSKICDSVTKYVDEVDVWAVEDGWIYYANYADGAKLYKVRTDGTGKRKLADNEVRNIYVKDKWICFWSGDESGSFIMKTDGTGKVQLTKPSSLARGTWFIDIIGDWVYVCDQFGIFRVRTDGTGEQYLWAEGDVAINTFVSGDWIYFEKWHHNPPYYSDGEIYKVNINGTTKTPIPVN